VQAVVSLAAGHDVEAVGVGVLHHTRAHW
jgi:hypothetical protein